MTSGTDAIVMGYPGGGGFVATPARIRELIELSGPDIYRNATVNREVYTVRASVEQGNTGGPLIDTEWSGVRCGFGAAVDDNDIGFVLTAKEVAAQLAHIGDTTPVATGECSADRRSRRDNQLGLGHRRLGCLAWHWAFGLLKLQRTRVGRAVVRRSAAKDLEPIEGRNRRQCSTPRER